MNIHQKIHAIMEEVSYVQKEDKKVNNQYKFVSHDAVTSKVRPALLKHGVLAVPSYFDISVDGNRTNCSMSITFYNVEKPDDFLVIPCAGFGQGIDPQDKGAGKAMSYAYKYALLKVFALETGDDPERDNVDYSPKVNVEPEYNIHAAQIKKCTSKADFVHLWNSPEAKEVRAKIKQHRADLYAELEVIKDRLLAEYKEAEEKLLAEFNAA